MAKVLALIIGGLISIVVGIVGLCFKKWLMIEFGSSYIWWQGFFILAIVFGALVVVAALAAFGEWLDEQDSPLPVKKGK